MPSSAGRRSTTPGASRAGVVGAPWFNVLPRMTDVSFTPDAASRREERDGVRHRIQGAPAVGSATSARIVASARSSRSSGQWWKYAGAKEQAIRELFDMSATRYYQVLNALVDKPEALAADPLLVKRLRRLRTSRQRTRAARRLGIEPW